MQILIDGAKGKKDSYVALSPILLDILRASIKDCKVSPLKFFFESVQPGIPYSRRSAQEVFRLANDKAS